jgi:putative ABC transport system permease protein
VRDVLYLAWRYLAHHRVKTSVLVASITLILFVPAALRTIVDRSEQQLTARAEATPLLVGMKGSPLELALSSLYFGQDVPERLPYGEAARVRETGLAQAIPLYVRFRAGKDPIVGTSVDYFTFRGLRIAAGRSITRLGDCVLGARVAKERGVGPGGSIVSSPETVFDLAGVYPLKMRVTGVLAPSGGPDDEAVFVDVKTAWVIEGLAHGHEDLTSPDATPRVLRRDEGEVVGNASVVQFNEITDDNVDSFHFHGDTADFPITAVLAVPFDRKSSALLRGRYEGPDETRQILQPATVMDDLLGDILTVEKFVVAAFLLVGLATLATAALVFLLSLRLRRREIETLVKIGGSKPRVTAVLLTEIVAVLVASTLLAALLTWGVSGLATDLIRTWVG